ncbi:MAG: beta galactosidase jelly roll domain-containing protein [Marinilabiliaceae bacterium]|nr:beta galactosidase jelly roll domain-containing protein [Marinilabiliaceae bacterium]
MRYLTRLTTITLALGMMVPMVAQIRLPKLVSDGMVLQHDTEVSIWGWGSQGEAIEVELNGHKGTTTTPASGKWQIQLKNLPAGGPYTMTIRGNDTVTINDVLVGDVWLCSGQSNMEMPMRRLTPLYGDEMAQCNEPHIREFKVPQRYNFNKAEEDYPSGKWVAASAATIGNISAVPYFFAKAVQARYGVPIGLINASLGGSPAEAWISEPALKQFPAYDAELQKFKDPKLIQQIESADNARIGQWYQTLQMHDAGRKDPQEQWHEDNYDHSQWDTTHVPGYWDFQSPLTGAVGAVWFRTTIALSGAAAGQPAKLEMGRIVDADSVFVNGVFVGTTSYQYPPRWYTIPANVLKAGNNTIAVKVIVNSGTGGFVPDKKYELRVGNETVNLCGTWHYRLGAKMESLGSQTFVRWKPAGLFNAMISPSIGYGLKGAIWYQGESNTDRSGEYAQLLKTLINDWREQWQQGDFPFMVAQLPNFMEPRPEPSESNWAALREAQQAALALPNTGMAVTIDLGEWNDIHPLDKKSVADRLALSAFHVAYGDKTIERSGPMMSSVKIKGSKIILTFAHSGSGLMVKGGGDLQEFAIAGADGRFKWAKAIVKGNRVEVWHPDIKKPVAVRYAWADNPHRANLYTKEGMPAAPFRSSTRPSQKSGE